MYIHDKKIAVSTIGIKFIQKYDSVGWSSTGGYGIRIKYKAAELVENYREEKDRDAMYDAIIVEISKRK